VEYIFGVRSPVHQLENQFSVRYRALKDIFNLYAQESSSQQRLDAAIHVSRLAAAGQQGMMDLYYQIADRGLNTGTLPIGTRVHITMLAKLMEESAAFGLQTGPTCDAESRRRCQIIAEQCGRLFQQAAPASEDNLRPGPGKMDGVLDHVEATIHSILVMPSNPDTEKTRELAVLRSKDVPFLIPGAFKDKNNIAFALKISLCATICSEHLQTRPRSESHSNLERAPEVQLPCEAGRLALLLRPSPRRF
jgi:multidrug resistance protein MdtO